MNILQNAIKITDNGKTVFLQSIHCHDYVSHTLTDGQVVAVDGGRDYLRRIGPINDHGIEDYSLTDEMPMETIADRLLWGTRGKNGDQPLTYMLLKDCSKAHLKAILEHCLNINPLHKQVIEILLTKE